MSKSAFTITVVKGKQIYSQSSPWYLWWIRDMEGLKLKKCLEIEKYS